MQITGRNVTIQFGGLPPMYFGDSLEIGDTIEFANPGFWHILPKDKTPLQRLIRQKAKEQGVKID